MSKDEAENRKTTKDIPPEDAVQPAAQAQDAIPQKQEKPIVLWKDWKFLTGFILVISSIVLGFFAKGLIIVNITQPFHLIQGLSVYAFSWVLLFMGIFLVGMETVRVIRQRINHQVRRTVKGTYQYTKKFPKESIEYTKKLHRKSMDGLSKTSKFIKGKMRKEHA